MNKRKLTKLAAVLLATASLIGLSACGSTTSAATSATTASVSDAVKTSDQGTTIYGKVTAINGSSLTLAVGTINTPTRSDGDDAQKAGDADRSQQTSATDTQASATTSTQNGGKTDRDQAGKRPGGEMNILTLTGETQVINLTDESILTRQTHQLRGKPGDKSDSSQSTTETTASTSGDASAAKTTLADIKVGSILKVTFDKSGTMTSVEILSGGGKLDDAKPAHPDETAQSQATTQAA